MSRRGDYLFLRLLRVKACRPTHRFAVAVKRLGGQARYRRAYDNRAAARRGRP